MPSSLLLPATGSLVAVDTETTGLDPEHGDRVTAISMAWREQDQELAVAVPFGQGPGKLDYGREAWDAVVSRLRECDLVFYNAFYDVRMIGVGSLEHPGVRLNEQMHWCTMMGQSMVAGGFRLGLKETADQLGLATEEELEHEARIYEWLRRRGLDKGSFNKVPWKLAEPYAKADALITLRLYDHQRELIERGESRRTLAEILESVGKLQRKLGHVLDEMDGAGIAVA